MNAAVNFAWHVRLQKTAGSAAVTRIAVEVNGYEAGRLASNFPVRPIIHLAGHKAQLSEESGSLQAEAMGLSNIS